MPQPPPLSGAPNSQARMTSGSPRPTTTGSASFAPLSANARISGRMSISLLSGMKPETITPGSIATGKARAASACEAAARSSGGMASRSASAERRKADLAASID